MNWIRTLCCCIAITVVFSIVLTGCTPYKESAKADSSKKKEEPPHPTKGPRGGPIAEWGNDDFHVEFTVDTSAKSAVVYILAGEVKDGKVVDTKIDPANITDVRLAIKDPMLDLDMKYDATRSGTDKTVFVAMHETFAKAGDYKGTINGKVKGKEPLTGDFPLK